MKNLYYNFFLIILILTLIKSRALKIDEKDKLNKRIKISEKKVRTECKVDDCLSCKEESSNVCEKCMEEYVLQNGKCYNANGLGDFLSDLKLSSGTKEKAVLDYITNNMIVLPKSKSEDSPIQKFSEDEKNKFETITNDFNSIREILSNLQSNNERECRHRINEFVVSFEQNMQVLLSLANLFEQKTIFEIEKQRNSILQLVTSETIQPSTKLELISKKLEDMNSVIVNTFETIVSKIKNYEEISSKKIARARSSFMIKLKKFLK